MTHDIAAEWILGHEYLQIHELSAQAIGHGKRSGDAIPFLFKEPDGRVSFNNTFSCDKVSDSWTWQMDNVRDGKPVPFGR